jgi:hypothetical protein
MRKNAAIVLTIRFVDVDLMIKITIDKNQLIIHQ